MAYLDEDILYNNIEEKYKSAKGKAREAYSDVLDTICEMPRANVAREIIDIIEQRRSLQKDASKGNYVDFWIGVYQGVDWAYRDIKEIIEQKYTEGKT